MLSASKISSIMAEEGPVVEVVIVRQSGEVEQVTLDMTPSLNKVAETLKGAATFIGQYNAIDVMVLKNRAPAEDVEVNKFTLPRPFHKEETKGDILLVRMDKDAIPQDFTKVEFDKFVEKVTNDPVVDAANATDATDAAGDTANDDDDDEEEEEEDDEDKMWEQVQEQIKSELRKAHGREPSEEEVQAALEEIQRAMAAAGEQGDEDDDGEFVPDEDGEEEEEEEEEEEGEEDAEEDDNNENESEQGVEDEAKDEVKDGGKYVDENSKTSSKTDSNTAANADVTKPVKTTTSAQDESAGNKRRKVA